MKKSLCLLLGFFFQIFNLNARVTSDLDQRYFLKIKKINAAYNKFSSNLESSGFFQIKNLNTLNFTEEERRFFKDTSPIFKIKRFDKEENYLYFYYKKTFAIRVNLDEILSGSLSYLGDKAFFVVTDPVNENHQKLLDFFNKFATKKTPVIKPKVFAKSLALYLKLSAIEFNQAN